MDRENNGRFTSLSEAEKQEIISCYINLRNQAEVARATRHSTATVSKIIIQAGMGRGRGGNQDRQTKVTDAQLVEACKTMTIGEIAEKFGMHRESLPRRFKKIGVYPTGYHAGRSDTTAANEYWKEHPDEKRGCAGRHIYGDCWHYVEAHKKKCDEKHPGFEYIESRQAPTQRVRLKCKKCGSVIERAASTFRQKNITCEACEERLELSEARATLLCAFLAIKDAKTPKTCKTCGGVFCSPYQTQMYCSPTCRGKRKRQKRKGTSYRSRCRKYGARYDASVTREAVIKRDGYICQICGKPTDPNDREWGTLGPLFPTVDHIIALANGGAHTWDNVQCAHAICNSYKRDLWADEFEEVLSCLA